MIDMNITNAIVMGYRDFAGPSDCTNDGIVCLDQDEIAYAAGAGKSQLVLAGVRPLIRQSQVLLTGTFFEEGQGH